MGCNEIRDMMAGYSSGELPGSGREAVESHVSECEECNLFLSRYEGVWTVLDEWKEIEPRTDFVSGFWAQVAEEERSHDRSLLKKLLHGWGLAGAFATVIIAGVFTFTLLTPQSDNVNYANNDVRDEQILHELDSVTARDAADSDALSIYGPWDNGVEIMRINGYGEQN
ncbi:MAG TPA: zf-HC2 domain-containing protein [Thermodesulfobacteriota bacterium]|nr:zf-HC2 domain-containing protein [Thermodesulfobacteriota bacterium]